MLAALIIGSVVAPAAENLTILDSAAGADGDRNNVGWLQMFKSTEGKHPADIILT